MVSITRNFNTDDNFWEVNPSFKTIRIFREFLDQDKSKKKAKSSQIMWAIAFLLDPHKDNPWVNLAEFDKKLLIEDEYLNDKKFNWDKYNHLSDEYYDRVLTPAEKDYHDLVQKMNERKRFIKDTPYSLDTTELVDGKYRKNNGTAAQLDKMIVDTIKLYDQLELIKTKLEKEKVGDGETKGGMQESATEKGLL